MNYQPSSLSLTGTFLITMLFLISSNSSGQTVHSSSSTANDSMVLAWVKDLYEPGVTVGDDSIILNQEAERLLKDQQYREVMYPAVYKWETAISFIQQQEIKKALWFFINLYLVNDQNKELVIKSLLIYDKLFKMEKILVSAFYTYILTDPEIGTIEDGHSKITAPHIMEKKLNALKEMLFYLDKYKPENRKEEVKNH